MKYRKHIRLKNYDYNSDAAYFVTICTDNRLPIISNGYKSIIEEELKSLVNRFPGVELDYYIFMPQHIHFILFLYGSKASIPQIIQAFKSLTALKIKKQGYPYKRFWQPNYYEHVIRNEKALHRIRKYIIDNPAVEGFNWKELEKA